MKVYSGGGMCGIVGVCEVGGEGVCVGRVSVRGQVGV